METAGLPCVKKDNLSITTQTYTGICGNRHKLNIHNYNTLHVDTIHD